MDESGTYVNERTPYAFHVDDLTFAEACEILRQLRRQGHDAKCIPLPTGKSQSPHLIDRMGRNER